MVNICASAVICILVSGLPAVPAGETGPGAAHGVVGALVVAGAEEALLSRPESPRAVERRYRVTGFGARYVQEIGGPAMPPLLADLEVGLARVNEAYTAPQEGDEIIALRLGDVTPEAPVWITRSAADRIAIAIAASVTQALPEGLHGAPVFAAVDPRDLDPHTGRDRRPGADALRFRVEVPGAAYTVNEFVPKYEQARDIETRPSIDELMRNVRVDLVRTPEGYVTWRPEGTPGVELVNFSLEEIAQRPPEPYTLVAIREVATAVVRYLTADEPGRRLMGVLVQPSLDEIRADATTVRLPIVTGEVAQVRSLAAGERFDHWTLDLIGAERAIGPARVNHRAHERIRERSPVQPQVGHLLDKREIDEYVYFLQRHPGRKVDVALAPGDEPYTVNVDYLITENRPWMIYGQVSNTGTKQTGTWRARFGLMHSQLTGNDDILALDYNTAEFSRTHAFTGSYEARVFDSDRLRWRVHGLWSEFQASDVGIPFLEFNGETWMVGAELIWNFFQDRQLFIDAIGGARFMHAAVENIFAPPGIVFVIGEASKDFIIPYAGLRLQRTDDRSAIHGSVIFEGSIGEFTNLNRADLSGLGRPFPDKDWFLMQWDVGTSFFIEPLLNPEGWRDPASWHTSTLAHELMLGFKGQYAFGNRLIPQTTMVAGGLFTVRGYPESVVAGDTVLIGTAEYRFHLPRALQPDPMPGSVFGETFRWSPQHVYGRPDWNLILRGFVDAGRTIQSERFAFEADNTLIGAGVGVEVSIRRNLNVRVDWGFALSDVEDAVGTRLAKSGSSRVHFSATLLY